MEPESERPKAPHEHSFDEWLAETAESDDTQRFPVVEYRPAILQGTTREATNATWRSYGR